MEKYEEFPSGDTRRKAVEDNRKRIKKFEEEGAKKVLKDKQYSWINSPLDGAISPEGEPFYFSFKDLLPTTEGTLKHYIEETLKERKGEAIAVEFGGVGSELFKGFTPDFFKKSVSISLVDHRPPYRIPAMEASDKKINHTLLIGDIFSPDTYKKLDDSLKGEKVDLIMERMAAGLEFVPGDPFEASKTLKKWYSLLREGGIMFVQIPYIFNNLLDRWIAKIKREYKDVLEVECDINTSHSHTTTFRLRKLVGAPEEMPELDVRTTKETRRVW